MSDPEIVLVAAVGENGVIGADNDMPWRLPTDLRHFKQLTLGMPVIMGRKTFETLGKALPGRPNIVITRNREFEAPGASAVSSLEDAFDLARKLAEESAAASIVVMGGGQIYKAAMPFAGRLEITRVHAKPEGDTRFPDIDQKIWRETSRTVPELGPRDSAGMTFLTYRRRA